jgi:anaerobic ribonucleoside-triphosphate reductase
MLNPAPTVCEKCELQNCETCKIRPARKCGKPTEIYSRVCGYFQPVKKWNIGKKEEMRDRKVYKV